MSNSDSTNFSILVIARS